MSVPENLKYTKDHEWIRQDGDAVVIGITAHAAEQLGDVVYVELPDVGASFGEGDSFGTVESVKAVSDLFMPVAGEVLEVNDALTDAPDAVNSDPYDKAWMIKVKPSNADAMASLMDSAAYEASLEN